MRLTGSHNADTVFDAPPSGHRSKAARRAERRAEKVATETAKRSRPLVPRNEAQREYMEAIDESVTVFGIGSPGAGKTYIPARKAMQSLIAGSTSKIILARAAVSKPKHRMGWLPGNMKEKSDPWIVPIKDAFKDEVSATTLEKLERDGKIEYVPFEHIQGRTFNDSWVLLDEAENCDLEDFYLFLTRTGENSKVVICGDTSKWQAAIPNSGLAKVLDMIETFDIDAEIIEFGPEDVVRSRAAAEWVSAFSRLEI